MDSIEFKKLLYNILNNTSNVSTNAIRDLFVEYEYTVFLTALIIIIMSCLLLFTFFLWKKYNVKKECIIRYFIFYTVLLLSLSILSLSASLVLFCAYLLSYFPSWFLLIFAKFSIIPLSVLLIIALAFSIQLFFILIHYVVLLLTKQEWKRMAFLRLLFPLILFIMIFSITPALSVLGIAALKINVLDGYIGSKITYGLESRVFNDEYYISDNQYTFFNVFGEWLNFTEELFGMLFFSMLLFFMLFYRYFPCQKYKSNFNKKLGMTLESFPSERIVFFEVLSLFFSALIFFILTFYIYINS